jgi:hypothetical protein
MTKRRVTKATETSKTKKLKLSKHTLRDLSARDGTSKQVKGARRAAAPPGPVPMPYPNTMPAGTC